METRTTDDGLRATQEELTRLIARFTSAGTTTPADGGHPTAIGPLTLIRYAHPTRPTHVQQRAALWIVAQGRKELVLADEAFTYGPESCLLVTLDLPVATRVLDASPDAPFLGLAVALDPPEVAATMTAHDLCAVPPEGVELGRGVSVRPATPELLGAVVRLVRLLDAPADARALAPLVLEEIRYRLLTGPHGLLARQIARADPRLESVARATAWLAVHYTEPYRLGALTRAVGMSASALHRHFKAVTAMTPLQYQKELRLREARVTMLREGLDAATAGRRVGYASPSQFSREYRRLFGAPPARDAARLRAPREAA